MKLQLKDRIFPIKSATLAGYITDPYWHFKYDRKGDAGLSWSLEVRTQEQVFEEEAAWEPYAYHENLKFPIRHWEDLENTVLEWSSPFDATTGAPNGCF